MNKVKNLLLYYKHLSILNKFLLVPILGVIFILPFYLYIASNAVDMKSDMSKINNESIPIYESTLDNIVLLEKILNELNSAVVSKELDWIENTDNHSKKFIDNLKKYDHSSYKKEINLALSSFKNYIKSAKNVSAKLIKNNYSYDDVTKDTSSLVKSYNNTHKLLNDLKNSIKIDIKENVNSIYTSSNSVVTKGGFIFVIWLAISAAIIYYAYMDFKIRIKEIIQKSKQIASGDADFNNRLHLVSNDELGEIADSINLFIDKLHNSHKDLATANNKLNELYIHDQLTGLYTRTKIDELIDIEIKRADRYNSMFSIILVDIDHFKKINDTYGHLVGDDVLKDFSSILKNNVRDLDYVGRWGGEEFIIVCTQTNSENAVLLAEKLRTKVENFNFKHVGKQTASFGVAFCAEEVDENIILDNADKALYRAKKTGRNRVVNYYDKIN